MLSAAAVQVVAKLILQLRYLIMPKSCFSLIFVKLGFAPVMSLNSIKFKAQRHRFRAVGLLKHVPAHCFDSKQFLVDFEAKQRRSLMVMINFRRGGRQ